MMKLPVELAALLQSPCSLEIVPDNACTHRKRKLASSFKDSHLPMELQNLFQYEPRVVCDNARLHHSSPSSTSSSNSPKRKHPRRVRMETATSCTRAMEGVSTDENDDKASPDASRQYLLASPVKRIPNASLILPRQSFLNSLPAGGIIKDHHSLPFGGQQNQQQQHPSYTNPTYSMKILQQVLRDLDDAFGRI